MTENIVFVALFTILAASSADWTSKELDELAVGIEFTEYDFEDFCATRSDIYWQFYRGSASNLSAVSREEFWAISSLSLYVNLEP